MLYHVIDQLVLRQVPLVGEYRQLGNEIREFRRQNPGNSHLSQESIQFVKDSEEDAGFKAYWEVQAQYNLINTHVFGEDPHSYDAKKACSEIGRVFQWIKAADNIVDEIKDPLAQANMLAVINEKIHSKEYDSVAQRFLLEEYWNFSEETQTIIQTVYDIEISRLEAYSDNEKMKFRSIGGDMLGHLEYKIMLENGLIIPDRADAFLRFQGIAGSFFDDVKDFNLDRKNNEGYRGEVRHKLVAKGVSNFIKSLNVLTREEKKRHVSFLMLGGMYQLRELIGMKERT